MRSATPTSRVDQATLVGSAWMARHDVTLIRISLGIVFLWFGALKLFPGLSPAEELAGKTMLVLSGGILEPGVSVPALGAWECLIGLGLLTRRALRLTLLSLFAHMVGTVTPVVLFPGDVFVRFPFVLTFEGQYIIKNVVLVSAAMVVGATVRGHALAEAPAAAPVIAVRPTPAPQLLRRSPAA